MWKAQWVLAVVALYVGVAHSWDFAVSSGDELIFYTNDGTETDRVQFKRRNLGGLAYDPVHDIIFYVDKQNNNDAIFGYNLSSKENEYYVERSGRNILNLAYDPATEKLFFTDANKKSINWISLKREDENNIYGNLLIKLDDRTPDDIAVDSCGGYIYWTKSEHIEGLNVERAHLDGSGREALNNKYIILDINSLAIDPQRQRVYYFNAGLDTIFLKSADKNGRHEIIYFYKDQTAAKELTVSKDYFYFVTTTNGESYKRVWRVSKNSNGFIEPEEIIKFNTTGSLGLVANYKLDDQIKGIEDCDSLSNLISTTEAPDNAASP